MTVTQFNLYQQITSVRLCAVGNIPGSYFNGPINNGIGSTLTALAVGSLTVDGITVQLGDRLLLPSQTNQGENGIWVVNNVGSFSSLWVLERSPDFQSLEQLNAGQYFSVGAGETLAGSMFVLVEPLPSVIGTTGGNFTFVNIGNGGGSGGPFFAVANDFSEISSASSLNQAAQNLGLGDGTFVVLTESSFISGQYFLTNPCPNLVIVNCNTPGSYALILPPATGPKAFQLFQGPMVHNVGTQTLNVFASGGPFQPNIIPGAFQHILLIDNSSSSGLWEYQGIVTSVNVLTGDVVLNGSNIESDYTPSNYTPIDNTIAGNLAGIDNALAASSSQDLQDTYNTGDTANINLSSNRPFTITNASSSSSVNAIVTPSGGTNVVANNRVLGWTFIPSINMLVTALQYDLSLMPSPNTRETGIFVRSTQELLGSVIISNSDPLDGTGTFRTATLNSPIQLFAGNEYVYATVVPANEPDHTINNAVPNTNISIIERAELPATSVPLALTFPQSFTTVSNYVHVGSFEYQLFASQDSFSVNDQLTSNSTFLQVKSLDKGAIPVPEMTISQRNSIPSPPAGLTVITTDSSPPRYSVFDGSVWQNEAYLTDLSGGDGGIPASYGEMFVNANTRVTTLSTSSFTKIEAGNPVNPIPDFSGYLIGDVYNFSFSNGRLTYNGSGPIEMDIVCELTLALGSGSTPIEFAVAIAKNGLILSKTQAHALVPFASGTYPVPITSSGLVSLTTGDYLEIFASNVLNTGNTLLVRYLDFKVSNAGTISGTTVAPTYGEMYFQGNTTVTPIATAGTPIKVSATYNSGLLNGFTQTGGTLTYIGTSAITAMFSANVTAYYNGSAQKTSFYIAINGSVLTKSKEQIYLGPTTNQPMPDPVKSLSTLNPGDIVELWVSNDDNANQIIVQDINFSVTSISSYAATNIILTGQNYLSLVGNTLTANPVNLSNSNVTGTLGAVNFPGLVGDVNTIPGSLVTNITAQAVTYPKIQNVSTNNRLLGRSTSGAGSIEEITVGSGLTLSGGVLTAGTNITYPLVTLVGLVPASTTDYGMNIGTFISMMDTVQGTRTFLGNSVKIGDSIEMSVTGITTAVTSGGSGIVQCKFGPITMNSPTLSSTLGGSGSIRSWSLVLQATRVSSNQICISASGYYEDDSHVVRNLQLYHTPAVDTFDWTVNNNIDILYNMTIGNTAYAFIAQNVTVTQNRI